MAQEANGKSQSWFLRQNGEQTPTRGEAIYLPYLLSIYLTEFSGEGIVGELLTNETGNRIPNPQIRLTYMNAFGKVYQSKELTIEFKYGANSDKKNSEATAIYETKES